MNDKLRQTFALGLVDDVILFELFCCECLVVNADRIEIIGHQLGFLLIRHRLGNIFGWEDIGFTHSNSTNHDFVVVFSLFDHIFEFELPVEKVEWKFESFLTDSTEVFGFVELIF